MDTDSLRKYLEFYQDLGIKTLYKQAAPEREIAAPEPVVVAPPAPVAVALPPAVALPVIPELPPMAPEGDTLQRIIEDMGDCRRCRLHEGRNKIVFGVGNP